MKVPSTAITIRSYIELEDFARKFASLNFNLIAVVGTAGLAKSKTFEKAMGDVDHCLVKGHATAFSLYKRLCDHQDEPIVIDDADSLYLDKKCQPLLKCLCETADEKTLSWDTRAIDDSGYPSMFKTASKVAILCNEWSVVNNNMRAVADRGLLLHFLPTVYEVHRQVDLGRWLNDDEVFQFIEKHLHLITLPSMRYYHKAKQLKDSKKENWKDLTLNMLNPDLDNRAIEVVSKLLAEEGSEAKKIEKFRKLTDMSRATYFRYKKVLGDSR